MTAPFVPVQRMQQRAALAREDSDTSYFFDLLYLGEMIIKVITLELVSGLSEERERHRHALECRLVRADGIGEWAEVLDEVLTGPASQHLVTAARHSQRALTQGFGPRDDVWQRRSVLALADAVQYLDGPLDASDKSRVSLRHWVRHFAWLRNRTRGHGATQGGTFASACPALEQSILEISTNAPAFARPWAHLKRNMSGKYRVSCFGGDRDRFAHLLSEKHHILPDGTYVFLDSIHPVPLLLSDADLADFLLPNGNFRKATYEALSYITDEVRSIDATPYLITPQTQPISETASRPELDVVGNVFTNMPPRREGYVQRAALEQELSDKLLDSRNPVITLQGRGGVGKTSLALKVLHDLTGHDDFFAFVWFSARDIDLLPDGPRLVRADILSLEEVARDFHSLMGRGSNSKPATMLTYLTDCLSGQSPDGPFIFVLDNFETIRGQTELYTYLNNAVRLPNKVLITTRTREFKADYPINVQGMTREEYSRLVTETASRLGIRNLISTVYEEQLFEESDGHPYITKVLLGEVAKAAKPIALKRVVATRETVLDALFERSYAVLSPAAQRVFLTLCSWRSLVPRIGLEAVLMRPDNEHMDVEQAIAELEQTSLVEEVTSGDSGASFLSVPLAAALFGKRKLLTSPMKIAIDADLVLVRDFGAATVTDVERGLGPRVDRITRAIAERADASGDLSDLAVLEYIATDYPPAWLNLAQLQAELGKHADALRSINRYLEQRPTDLEGWRRLSDAYRAAQDTIGEMHARLQLAELAKPPFDELSKAAVRLNGLLSRRELLLTSDERRGMAAKLRRLMEARHSEADATDLSRLAWLCLHDRDEEAATKWTEKGLILDPDNEHCLSLRRRLSVEG